MNVILKSCILIYLGIFSVIMYSYLSYYNQLNTNGALANNYNKENDKMVEIITTSTKILDLEHNGVCVEISTVETERKTEVELYAFKGDPEKNRKLLARFITDDHRRKDELLTEVYSIIQNPCEWLCRYEKCK